MLQNKELCEEYMGQYPVIFLSLKGVDGLNFEEAKSMLKDYDPYGSTETLRVEEEWKSYIKEESQEKEQ